MARKLSPTRSDRGFTLVELLVVILILAILMAVAIPAYLAAVRESQRRTCRANMKTIANVEQAHLLRPGNSGYVIGDAATLRAKLVGTGGVTDLQALPSCPTNHEYRVDAAVGGGFTVHCSDPNHDANADGTSGYQLGRDRE
jgi:type IV pilus assembly protein PilA